MRKFTLFISVMALGATSLHAQTVAHFDDLTLPAVDTYYVNYSASGTDVGFNDGLAHFPCFYDSSGGYWSWFGFAYSNMTDSVTNGYTNEYSAKTAIGYSGSAKYAVLYCSNPVTYAYNFNLNLTGAAVGKPVSGFYITNSTYAYNAIAQGYPVESPARKFHSGDWFLLTIKGYLGGVMTTDSVNFYLADFRFTDTTMNYIVKTWQWVNLLPLGHVDSLRFSLSSTDNGTYGMNTPGYFCMDNFTTNETSVGVNNIPVSPLAKIYPNPATDQLYIEVSDRSFNQISIMDMVGNIVYQQNVYQTITEVNIAGFAPGNYIVEFEGDGKHAVGRFVKK